MLFLMTAVIIFFIIALVVDAIVIKIAEHRLSRLSDDDLRRYKVNYAGSYLYGIYARALDKELYKRNYVRKWAEY